MRAGIRLLFPLLLPLPFEAGTTAENDVTLGCAAAGAEVTGAVGVVKTTGSLATLCALPFTACMITWIIAAAT